VSRAKTLTHDEYAQLYTDLCDAVCRVALNIPDTDPLRHTSDVSRSTAIKIMDVLVDHDLVSAESPVRPGRARSGAAHQK
jgi:hypothetical protein